MNYVEFVYFLNGAIEHAPGLRRVVDQILRSGGSTAARATRRGASFKLEFSVLNGLTLKLKFAVLT